MEHMKGCLAPTFSGVQHELIVKPVNAFISTIHWIHVVYCRYLGKNQIGHARE